MKEITVKELHDLKESSKDSFVLLDVREEYEIEIASIGGTNIPLSIIPEKTDELSKFKDQKLVVMCRSGGRSAKVVQYLDSQGFQDVYNLKGGILAWNEEIDDSIPRY